MCVAAGVETRLQAPLCTANPVCRAQRTADTASGLARPIPAAPRRTPRTAPPPLLPVAPYKCYGAVCATPRLPRQLIFSGCNHWLSVRGAQCTMGSAPWPGRGRGGHGTASRGQAWTPADTRPRDLLCPQTGARVRWRRGESALQQMQCAGTGRWHLLLHTWSRPICLKFAQWLLPCLCALCCVYVVV